MTSNRNLNLLLSGQLVSQIGDKFYLLALALWVLDVTGSAAKMGLVIFASLFPLVLTGLVSGAYVDRHDRKKIIVGTDLLRGLIIVILAAAYYADRLNLAGVLAAQVLLAVNTAFFNPAIPAVIPQVVDPNELSKANARFQFISGFANIMGPILGGAAVAACGVGPVLTVNAVSFFISAGFECFLRIPPGQDQDISRESLLHSLSQGYGYLFGQKPLVIIAFMVAVIHFFVGSMEVIMPVLASLVTGPQATNLGFLQASFGAGMVGMAALIGWHGIHGREAKTLFSAVSCVGLIYLFIGSLAVLLGSQTRYALFALLPLFLLFGAAIALAATSFQSLLQQMTANALAGRVFSVVGSIGNVSIPLAALIYGLVLAHVPCARVLIGTGIILLPMGAVCYKLFVHWGDKDRTKAHQKMLHGARLPD